jgi:hypothetical protein
MPSKLFGAIVMVMASALMLISSGCFSNGDLAGSSNTSPTPTAVKPKPRVESVIANTSGTQISYYATLDIKVKNEGSEGTILVIGSVTQAGKTSQNQMEVFLKQGEDHELKLTYPLVWQGGDFTTNVQAIVP